MSKVNQRLHLPIIKVVKAYLQCYSFYSKTKDGVKRSERKKFSLQVEWSRIETDVSWLKCQSTLIYWRKRNTKNVRREDTSAKYNPLRRKRHQQEHVWNEQSGLAINCINDSSCLIGKNCKNCEKHKYVGYVVLLFIWVTDMTW